MPLHYFYLNWPQIDHSSLGPAFSFFCNSLPTIRLFLVFPVSVHLCLILIWSSTCCNFDQCLLYLAKQLQSRACFGVLGFGDQLLIQFSGIAICVRRSIVLCMSSVGCLCLFQLYHDKCCCRTVNKPKYMFLFIMLHLSNIQYRAIRLLSVHLFDMVYMILLRRMCVC